MASHLQTSSEKALLVSIAVVTSGLVFLSWPHSDHDRGSFFPRCLQMDEEMKEITRKLVRCSYGSPQNTASKIPAHSASVEVAVRESAFNPLSSPSAMAQRDERIYVAFQQHISFQVCSAGRAVPLLPDSHFTPGPSWLMDRYLSDWDPSEFMPNMITVDNMLST